MAFRLVVKRRWPWLSDYYYSEYSISATAHASGVLTISNGFDKMHTYAPGRWREVISTEVPSRAKV